MRYSAALLTLALFVPLSATSAQGKSKGAEKKAARHERMATIYAADQLTWTAAPPSLPAGAKIAVLDGNPMKGGAFIMRLMMPDGYQIAPHFHPADEHVTVIKGTLLVGMGEKFDESQMNGLGTGGFGMIPRGMRHYAKARGETILQLNGMGPWRLVYVNKADDPSKSVAKE